MSNRLNELILQSKNTTPPKETVKPKPMNSIEIGGITIATKPKPGSSLDLAIKQNAMASALDSNPKPEPKKPASIGDIQLDIRSDVADWPHEENENYDDSMQGQLRSFLQQVNDNLVTDEVSNAMQRCLTFIQQHPETKDLLLPEDIGLMTRALQSSNGVVIAKKQTRRASKAKSQQKTDELSDALAGLGDWAV